jgi:Trypsin
VLPRSLPKQADYGSQVAVGQYEYGSTSNGMAQYREIQGLKVVHPNFTITKAGIPSYDLVLFKIQAVDKPHLRPIKLNTELNTPAVGDDLTTIGFGNTAWNTSHSSILLKTTLQHIPTSTCETMYGRKSGSMGDSIMCSLGVNSTTCLDDSGGPVVDANGTLVGVAAFGSNCTFSTTT